MARTKISSDDLQDSLLNSIQSGGVGDSSNTEILFNDSGAANGNSALTFDKTTGTLTAHNILPAANNTYSLGNTSFVWKDVYIGPGSLYINGKQVLSESANTIIVSTSTNQSIAIQTDGTGGITLDPQGTGVVQVKNTLQMLAGKSITSSDGTPIGFGNPIAVDSLSSKTLNTDLTLTANGTGSVRVTDDLIITGNIIFTGTSFTVNTQIVSISDNIIDLNSDFTSGTPTENAGIRVIRGDEPAVIIRWNETLDRWEYTSDGTNFTEIGQKGDKGEVGDKGDKGEKGDVEAQGAKGDKGDKGDTGADGIKGDKGEVGDKGDKGDAGADGAKGDKGDAGADGVKGDKGERVSSASFADANNTLTFTNSDTSTFDVTGVKGQKGDKGADGGGGGGALVIQEEGTGSDTANTLNFVGDAITAVVNTSTGVATITVSGTGGGGGGNGAFGVTVDTFTANGTANTFTLSTTPLDEDHIIVVIDGVTQLKSVYTVSGTTLTLDGEPANNSVVEVSTLAAIPSSNGLFVQVDTFTGNGTTNTYTLSATPVNENFTFVSINGVLQHKGSYSVSGSSLILSENVANNHAIEAVVISGVGVGPGLDSISSDVIPSTTETYDLGSSSKKWKDLYLSGNTIYLGNTTISASDNDLVLPANTKIGNTNTSLPAGGAFSFRNKIINGNFDIWQRGTSQTSSGYGSVDRWRSLNVGTTKTASRQAFALGQTDVPNSPKYFMRHVVSSVAGASNYASMDQKIEGVETLSGKTVTATFWAKADASKNIAVEFLQYFGSGGSPSTFVIADAQLVALTTSWTKYTITVALPSVSGKTVGSDGNDDVRMTFWFDAGSNNDARAASLGQQSGTFDIAQVQLEEGSAATPFEQRPIGMELDLCYRYYVARMEVSGAGNSAGNGQTDRSISSISFPSTFRTSSPTITYTHIAGANLTGSWSVISTNAIGCTMRYPAQAAGSTYWRGVIEIADEL